MYGETASRSAIVDVTNRGSTWEAESGVVEEGPGVTPCRDWNAERDLWGQMTHVDCHPNLIAPDGHVVNGGGPWEGLYFVDLSSLAVRLKKILRPQLYDNGPEYDFVAIVSAISAHEDEHVDSAMAVVRRMNIYEELDPLAGPYDRLKRRVDDKVELAARALVAANSGVDHSGAEYGRFWRRVEQYNEWHWYKLVERD